ncbi:MAG: hypothetical protein ABIO60_03015 [Aquaticitalea sp.]
MKRWSCLFFGSGSKSPERDVLAKVRFKDKILSKVYDLGFLYSSLRKSSLLDAESLNIEAAATLDNLLYLFNREHNLLMIYHLPEILGFLEGQNDVPLPKIYQIILPLINGISAKFSGASPLRVITNWRLPLLSKIRPTPTMMAKSLEVI